jgi:uncharacterized coiled-coil protein SlyX
MTKEDNERRIATLQAKSRDERARIAELNDKLGELKQLLTPASSQLDDVDQFFLGAEILSQPRTPQELARWLSHADAVFKRAVASREYVEGLATKFGPDARVIGG